MWSRRPCMWLKAVTCVAATHLWKIPEVIRRVEGTDLQAAFNPLQLLPKPFTVNDQFEGNSIICVCLFSVVLLDIIAHHLSFLKPRISSQAGSSSREVSGDIQKALPNQYTEYERWQGMAEPQPLLPLLVSFLIPLGRQTFRWVSPTQWCFLHASWTGLKIHQARYHFVYANLEFHGSQVSSITMDST